MLSMYYTHLTSRGLLSINGPDTLSLLQGVITQDTRLIEQGRPVYAALLTPQGKYLHDFFLYPTEGGVLLDGEKERLADLKTRLMLYKLRSDVQIAVLSERKVAAIWGEGEPKPTEGLFEDPRLPALGWRMIGEVHGYEQVAESEYDKMRLQVGAPDGSRDMIPEKSLMLECGMDRLNAISFDKGCYVGQEVTARSKHRGQVRKQFYRVKAAQGALPDTGTAIMLDDKAVGEMRSHNGAMGLAMLRIEAVQAAQENGVYFASAGCQLTAEPVRY